MEPRVSVAHDRGTLSGPELQLAVDAVLEEIRAAKDLHALAESVGLTAEDVCAMTVEIDESKEGIDPVLAYILIHLAGGAVSAAGGAGATLFWKKIILPRLRRAKRVDAIGNERTGEDLN